MNGQRKCSIYSLKKKRNPAICNKMDICGDIAVREIRRWRKMHTVYPHLYVESKNVNILETE